MITTTALACDWEGDWHDEMASLLAAIFGPVEELLRVLRCTPMHT